MIPITGSPTAGTYFYGIERQTATQSQTNAFGGALDPDGFIVLGLLVDVAQHARPDSMQFCRDFADTRAHAQGGDGLIDVDGIAR
jgi:hypothetical protein